MARRQEQQPSPRLASYSSGHRRLLPLLLCLACLALPSTGGSDLYKVLGVSRGASVREIKAAYRAKARDTHPDKQLGVDPQVAAEAFREVVSAYETLSDDHSRRRYDQTGQTSSSRPGASGHHHQQQQWGFNFQWSWGAHGDHHHHHSKFHRFYRDPWRRRQILDAQSRVLSIQSLQQLRSVLYRDQPDDDDGQQQQQGGDGRRGEETERYCLLAFYDSTSPASRDRLDHQVLFPWPFAGQSSEGSSSSGEGSIWWEEIMVAAQVDVATPQGKALAKRFGIDGDTTSTSSSSELPYIALIPRGSSLEDDHDGGDGGFTRARAVRDSDELRAWVWGQLKMSVSFTNRTPWPLHLWWIDGFRGHRRPDVQVGESIAMDTFISHSFFFRADFVTGHTLTNQSALLWYTARIQDDGASIDIRPRCFDHSGECARWRMEGFCDRSQPTFYTRQNPGHYDYVLANCPVSCGFGCGAAQPTTASSHDDEL